METISLRQGRLLREKTQEEMAIAAHMGINTYRRIEEHPDEATVAQAKLLSAFLGFSYDTLFFGGEVHIK